ncbi:hypothetical protein BRADI_3g30104v3 [Brachypodium distachyon]|uniref:Uncharacterized protein n=1 Tax=Brachypodium distachyon TaxID=15368 RepID=A0A0Q3FGS9_BRADI|nr:hypothetical protein BRADI_3g30104v3 [Brachypodium distachyon]
MDLLMLYGQFDEGRLIYLCCMDSLMREGRVFLESAMNRRLFFFQKLGDCFLVRNQAPVLVSKNRRLLYRQTRKPFCSDPMKIHWCFFFISTDDMLEYGREGRNPD